MLQTIANIISIIAGLITILGIGGIVSWSIFKKSRTQWSDTVLSVFSYGVKTAWCITLGAITLSIYLFIAWFILAMLQAILYESAWGQNAKFRFEIAVYLVLVVFHIPIYLVLCSCIYKSSWGPWQRFWEILIKKKNLEVLEARYYSVRNPNNFRNATDQVKDMVLKGKRKFSVDNDIVGDPEKGTKKELTVKYKLDGEEKTKTVTEGSTMFLD